MSTPIFGTATSVGIGDTSTVDVRLDFMRCTYGVRQIINDYSGMRGVRSRSVEKTRESFKDASGELDLVPTAVEWSQLLPWIYGGTAVGTSYPLADTLAAKYLAIDRVEKVWNYVGVRVGRARISCRPGDALRLNLFLAGTTDSVANAGTFPSISYDTTTKPFTFQDSEGAITLGGVAYPCNSFEIEVDNMLNLDRYLNSVSRTAVTSTDRVVRCSFQIPLISNYAAYTAAAGVAAGAAVTATFTYGATSLLFSLVKVVFQRVDPVIDGRNNELMLDFTGGEAKKSGSTLELVTTLDSTP